MGFQPNSTILIKIKWSELKTKKIMTLSEALTNYKFRTSRKGQL